MFFNLFCSFFFFRLSEFFHPLLARLDIGAGVEQLFGCLSHRPEPSGCVVRRVSMDWIVEDDMVDGLFCATLTCHRGGHTTFVQAGAETSGTSAEAIEPDPGSSWEGHFGGVYWCPELKCGVLWGFPHTPRYIDDLPTAPHVCCFCKKNR